MNPRPALAAALLLALSGCVAFEHAPAAALSCDPALAGRWRSSDDGPGRDIVIDARCRAQWPVHGRTVEVNLRSYAEGPLRYLVLTPQDAERMLGDEGAGLSAQVPADSVFIAAYRIRGRQLRGWLPNADLVRASVQAGRFKGRLLASDEDGSDDNATVLMQSDAEALAALLKRGPEPLFGRLDEPGSEAVELKRIGAAP
ncbi:hypothetical protein ASD78_18200 [Lysobacter sp. Root667]|uniref:hypothetical protein n=1 Tax=Lysobacter sp. Root667 TaxID=1736581 RepID=UPI0006F6F35F|nr:hypothetical protein [Lysobacter sp. Root667]KRA70756.1 hypothetical protein ASD78_18200 [Lysobacter sp. Root667]